MNPIGLGLAGWQVGPDETCGLICTLFLVRRVKHRESRLSGSVGPHISTEMKPTLIPSLPS